MIKQDDVSIWLPLYIGDLLSMTTRLTTEQVGGLFLLMMDYWKNGVIPNSNKIIGAITGLSSIKAKALKKIIIDLEIFSLKDDELISHYLDDKKTQATDNKNIKSERAKKGAEARWNKRSSDLQPDNTEENQANLSNAQALNKQCLSNAKDMLEQCPLSSSSSIYINTHTQTSEEKNSPVEIQPQSEKTKAEIIREQRADELENWQPPTLEEISSQLFRIGFEINITQAQYESHVQDFKAYYIEQALYGKPLNTEALRKSKLRAWLQNAMQKQKTNHNSNSTGVKNATHQQNRTKRTTRPEYTDKLEQQRQTYFTQSTVGERTMRDVYPVENVVSQQNECR